MRGIFFFICVFLLDARKAAAKDYPALLKYKPQYDVLGVTKWSNYPNCWVFPMPSLTLLINSTAYLVSSQVNSFDTSEGMNAAKAWCQSRTFDSVGDFQIQDWPNEYKVQTYSIGSGKTCTAVCTGAACRCSSYKFVECIRGSGAKAGCSKISKNVGLGVDNRGFMNDGSTNIGNFNNGSSCVGDFNFGSANVGSFNLGSGNVGNALECSACKGDKLKEKGPPTFGAWDETSSSVPIISESSKGREDQEPALDANENNNSTVGVSTAGAPSSWGSRSGLSNLYFIVLGIVQLRLY